MYSKDQVDVEYATEYTTLKFIEIKLGLFKDLESLEGCELDEDKTPRKREQIDKRPKLRVLGQLGDCRYEKTTYLTRKE